MEGKNLEHIWNQRGGRSTYVAQAKLHNVVQRDSNKGLQQEVLNSHPINCETIIG